MRKKKNLDENNEILENEEESEKIEILRIELDGLPPTVNHMYLSVRGRKFRTKDCAAYQDYVLNKMTPLRASEWSYSGRMALTLIFTAADKRRWDIDNRIKSIQDCLARSGIIKDDSQIDELLVKRKYGKIAKTALILYKMD